MKFYIWWLQYSNSLHYFYFSSMCTFFKPILLILIWRWYEDWSSYELNSYSIYLIGYGIHSVLIKHQNVQITLYLANICLYNLTYVVCLCVLCKPRDFTDTLATDNIHICVNSPWIEFQLQPRVLLSTSITACFVPSVWYLMQLSLSQCKS